MTQGYNVEATRKNIIDRLQQIAVSFEGRNRLIIDALGAVIQPTRSQVGDAQSKLATILWTEFTSIKDVFAGETYEVLVALFGDTVATKVRAIWERSVNYIFATGYTRRSFRAKYERAYLSPMISKLVALLFLIEAGFSPEHYFEDDSPLDNYQLRNFYESVVPDLLAYEIDAGNLDVKEKLRTIIFSETTHGDRIRSVIKALLMTHDSEAHQWVGQLLLAAKLQEGLRQAITELMDHGSREAFLYMLQLVLDHDLLRFSSVVRALDVWTGLGVEAQKPAVVKKCLTLAVQCLNDAEYVKECLSSNDTLLIYMALWAIAVDDVTATAEPLKALLALPKKYKRTTALYFLAQTNMPVLQHKLSVAALDDPEMEVKCWAIRGLFGGTTWSTNQPYIRQFGSDIEFDTLYTKLDAILNGMPKKELRYEETVFPWSFIVLSQDDIIRKMMHCSMTDLTEWKFNGLFAFRDKMEVDTRVRFVTTFVKVISADKQRQAVLEFLDDKSVEMRKRAAELAGNIEFTSEDYRLMEGMLRLKSGDLRKSILRLLLRQTPQALLQSIERLARERNENKQLGALDLIISAGKSDRFGEIVEPCREIAEQIARTTQKANVLAEKLFRPEQAEYTASNGFGLFDPNHHFEFPITMDTNGLAFPFEEAVKKILVGFDAAVDTYRDHEYEVELWGGQRQTCVLGSERYLRPVMHQPNTRHTLDSYPLPDVWRQTGIDLNATAETLLAALFFFQYSPIQGTHPWFMELTSAMFPYSRETCQDVVKALQYANHVQTILNGLLFEFPKSEAFPKASRIVGYIVKSIPRERFAEEYMASQSRLYAMIFDKGYLFSADELVYWLHMMKQFVHDASSFQTMYTLAHSVYRMSGYRTRTCLDLNDFERAFHAELIDDNELYAELMGRASSPENIRTLTSPGSHWRKQYASCEKLRECCNIATDRVLSIELKRGDMPTEVSRLAANIERCYGVRYFVDILLAGEKDAYTRGYVRASESGTKRDMFSSILKNCYPATNEDLETLREALNDRNVSKKQLIDAAMYAPQWLEIAEAYLGWTGLAMAGWYFHAHVSETFSPDKKTIVAQYSPIDPEDFQHGAFDVDWFREAYSTLGERRFKMVYDSAKYIAGGALHRRAQLFADAALGRLSVTEVEKTILQKRNKDYVLCLGLIPLASRKEDILQRYEFLQNFLKESKQFGALRRDSEAKAVSFALGNLARNAGYADTNRLTWSMETEKADAIAAYFQPTRVRDIEFRIGVDELGVASMVIEKDGKTLKSLPTSLKHDETVVKVKNVIKSLKDQYARAKLSLENAMVSETTFSYDELTNLTRHPVISPLLRHLVFKSGDKFGYLRDGALVTGEGDELDMSRNSSWVIAHPVHFYEAGVWSEFQRDIFSRQVVQPFKQVFRELYRPNADEMSLRTISQRYAGHQIQTKKTVSLLSRRGWTVSYEEGLQRVYHTENIIGHIYALADWFSPAEMEAPTIEHVSFTHRKTGEPLSFDEIPPIIFSEVMRDVDLVVSVAHVGGVDPEASHSTVEMRAVILEEILRLLRLRNVSIKGSHAHITGKLGEYTVHLGSGVVHKMASGAIHILPVHAQHRGRIFLPFVDDDPRTAEIISKIVLLADDTKIKDPNILEQLT